MIERLHWRVVAVAALCGALQRPAAPAAVGGRGARTVVRSGAEDAVGEIPGEPLLRMGHGYDIHRLDTRAEAGQPLVVGGVRFDGSPGHAPDFELGCVAHSDGDVVYHSVVDAILGALCLPDIGCLFPDNDPRLRGADSSIFMEEAYDRMTRRRYRIGNVDVTLIAQKPKVNVVNDAGDKVKELMRANLSRLLRAPVDRLNVKARTHEKVDSVGECRAIECHVVLTLERAP